MLQWNLGQPSHLDPHSNMFWTISVVAAAAAAAAAISQENDALVTQQSHLIDSRTAKNLLHPLKNSINSRFLCILIITFIIIMDFGAKKGAMLSSHLLFSRGENIMFVGQVLFWFWSDSLTNYLVLIYQANTKNAYYCEKYYNLYCTLWKRYIDLLQLCTKVFVSYITSHE